MNIQLDEMPTYQRYLRPRILEALEDTPVVLIHGPRQSGKSTLALEIAGKQDYQYVTFDDESQRTAAQFDPIGFMEALPERVVLDEIQRVPELMLSIKMSVDRNRKPGRFILTGSSNILLLPRLSDSLAGRMEILQLLPLAQAEVSGFTGDIFPSILNGGWKRSASPRCGQDLAEMIVSGGFPAALERHASHRRSAWYRDYVRSLIERDVQDVARIHSLDIMPRLMEAAAGQTARLLNISELSSPFSVSRPTIRTYVTILEAVFLLQELPSWHSNRLSRLVKAAKLHMGDTGLAASLLGVDAESLWNDRELFGQFLETWVFQELRRHASWREGRPLRFYHFRDKDKVEVDMVLEHGAGRIAGVEVKAAATVYPKDFKGLAKLRDQVGDAFTAGTLFYDGEQVLPFGDRLWAVPISALWS